MEDEKDNIVTGEILSSGEERSQQNNNQFDDEFYSQFQIRRIKTWHIFAVLAVILLIIGLAFYVFIKYIEVILVIIIFALILNFVRGLVRK